MLHRCEMKAGRGRRKPFVRRPISKGSKRARDLEDEISTSESPFGTDYMSSTILNITKDVDCKTRKSATTGSAPYSGKMRRLAEADRRDELARESICTSPSLFSCFKSLHCFFASF